VPLAYRKQSQSNAEGKRGTRSTLMASMLRCLRSSGEWRDVNLAREVMKASRCICICMTDVTCTANRNPSRHCAITASSSLLSIGTEKAASIGAHTMSSIGRISCTSVAAWNTDLPPGCHRVQEHRGKGVPRGTGRTA